MTNLNHLYKSESCEAWCPICKDATTFTEYLDEPGGYLNGVICGSCNSDRQNKLPAVYESHVYRKECIVCEKEHILLTQEDNSPEYYTEIGVICGWCKNTVWFVLPVN